MVEVIATSRNPQDPRKRTASLRAAPSASVRPTRLSSPVSGSNFARCSSRRSRSRRSLIKRTTPCARSGLPSRRQTSARYLPARSFHAALECILNLVRDTVAGFPPCCLLNDINARRPARGVNVLREGTAGADLVNIDAEQRGSIVAPGQAVGIQTPLINDVADRPQNLRGVENL